MPFSEIARPLKPVYCQADILLAIDGKAIDPDGNYIHPIFGKLSVTHLTTTELYCGQRTNVTVFRNGGTKRYSRFCRLIATRSAWRRLSVKTSVVRCSPMRRGDFVVHRLPMRMRRERSELGARRDDLQIHRAKRDRRRELS